MLPPEIIEYHKHVSEQVSGPDFGCRWASGVEFIHDGYNLSLPVSKVEWQALQKASGDTGFSNMNDFRLGVKKRYNLDLNPSRVGPAEVRERLTPGRIGLISGKLIGMDEHYRRWYPAFTGGHTVYVACYDPGEYWWCDPGAPKIRPSGRPYLGEPIDWPQLKAFIGNYGYQQIFKTAVVVPPPPVVVVPPVVVPPPDIAGSPDDAALAAAYNEGVAAVQAAANAVPLK